MVKEHLYSTQVEWTGNRGEGTSGYRAYDRAHQISVTGKPVIPGSSDPAFRGDKSRYNPEEMLVASLSACHMLWYLHLCAEAGVLVTAYRDSASGVMAENAEGGRFTSVILRPEVTVRSGDMLQKANALHREAHSLCYIARSVSFPVTHEPACSAEE